MKTVHKAFVLACSKELTRYGITHPWLAARDRGADSAADVRDWFWCATDGRLGVLRRLPSEDAERLENNLRELGGDWVAMNAKGVDAKLVVERETVEDAVGLEFAGTVAQPRVKEFRKDGSVLERRMIEVTPPDLPSIVRDEERVAREGGSAWIDVDADAMVRALEALLAGVRDQKGDRGPTRKMVRLWFRVDAEAVNNGAAKWMIDGSFPILVEATHESLKGSAAVVMPMGRTKAEEEERKEAIRKGKRAIEKVAKAGRAASPSPSISDAVDSVDAEEGAAIAREGGANA